MGEPVLFNHSSMFINCVLLHDIHWRQDYTWDSINLTQRKNQSITMDNIFLYQFYEKNWISQNARVILKERASFMSVAILLSYNYSSGHAEPFSKIFLVMVQFRCQLERTSREFIGKNSEQRLTPLRSVLVKRDSKGLAAYAASISTRKER